MATYQWWLIDVLFAAVLPTTAKAAKISGVTLSGRVTVNGQDLIPKGASVSTRLFLQSYMPVHFIYCSVKAALSPY